MLRTEAFSYLLSLFKHGIRCGVGIIGQRIKIKQSSRVTFLPRGEHSLQRTCCKPIA